MEKTKPFNIPKKLFVQAHKLVKANAGAAGVDHESLEDFERNLKDNLYKLWNRMSSGSYFPPPVKAVPIPKKSGGERILKEAQELLTELTNRFKECGLELHPDKTKIVYCKDGNRRQN